MSIHDHSLVILESIEEHSKHLIDEINEFSEKHPIEGFNDLINCDIDLNHIHNSIKALLEKMENLKNATTFMKDPKIVEYQEIIDLSEQLKDSKYKIQELRKQNKHLQEQLTAFWALEKLKVEDTKEEAQIGDVLEFEQLNKDS